MLQLQWPPPDLSITCWPPGHSPAQTPQRLVLLWQHLLVLPYPATSCSCCFITHRSRSLDVIIEKNFINLFPHSSDIYMAAHQCQVLHEAPRVLRKTSSSCSKEVSAEWREMDKVETSTGKRPYQSWSKSVQGCWVCSWKTCPGWEVLFPQPNSKRTLRCSHEQCVGLTQKTRTSKSFQQGRLSFWTERLDMQDRRSKVPRRKEEPLLNTWWQFLLWTWKKERRVDAEMKNNVGLSTTFGGMKGVPIFTLNVLWIFFLP